MRHSIFILALCASFAQAQTPETQWYRLTWQHVPVGFARGESKAVDFEGKRCLEVHTVGQFAAKPETLRRLPYNDYDVDLILDAQSKGLLHADCSVRVPVKPIAALESEYELVQEEVRFTADTETSDGRSSLLLHSIEPEVPDVEVPFVAKDFVVAEAVPRLVALRTQPWGGPALVAIPVATEAEAREGLTFAFDRRGRRDPFIDPRNAPQPSGPDKPPRDPGHPPKEPGAEFTSGLPKAQACLIEIVEAFNDQNRTVSQRLGEITQRVEQIRNVLAAIMPKTDAAKAKEILQAAQRYQERAKVRAEFDAERPEIRGIVCQIVDVPTPLKLGLELFKRPTVVDSQIAVPTDHGIVTLKLKGTDDNRSFKEGDRVGPPPSPLYVKRVLRARVCFEYKGEEIWVWAMQE